MYVEDGGALEIPEVSFTNNGARDACSGRDVYCEDCDGCPLTWNACGNSVQCGAPCREFWAIPVLIAVGIICAALGKLVLHLTHAHHQRIAPTQTLGRGNSQKYIAMEEGENLNSTAVANSSSVSTVALLISLSVSRSASPLPGQG